jgi:hypothetical protein
LQMSEFYGELKLLVIKQFTKKNDLLVMTIYNAI